MVNKSLRAAGCGGEPGERANGGDARVPPWRPTQSPTRPADDARQQCASLWSAINDNFSQSPDYRGGTIEEVIPLAKALKVAYLEHGIGYRLSRFQTGPNVGDWFFVVLQYDDEEKAHAAITRAPEIQRIFAEIAKIAKRISRETVIDLIFDSVAVVKSGHYNSKSKGPSSMY